MSLNDVFTSQTVMLRNRVCVSKFVVSKHLWREFLHGEPSYCLDISVDMLMCVLFTVSLSSMSRSATFDIHKKKQKRGRIQKFNKFYGQAE